MSLLKPPKLTPPLAGPLFCQAARAAFRPFCVPVSPPGYDPHGFGVPYGGYFAGAKQEAFAHVCLQARHDDRISWDLWEGAKQVLFGLQRLLKREP